MSMTSSISLRVYPILSRLSERAADLVTTMLVVWLGLAGVYSRFGSLVRWMQMLHVHIIRQDLSGCI